MTGQSRGGAARRTGFDGQGSLVLFPGALGDMVCLEPTVDRLAAEGPVRVLARGAAAEVARWFPARPEVGSIDSAEIARLFAPLPPGGAKVDDPVPPLLRGHRRLISFTGHRCNEFRVRWERLPGAICCEFPSARSGDHASHRMLRSALGDPLACARAPRLRSVGDEPAPAVGGRAWAGPTAGIEARARPLLVIHPGAGAPHKRAPAALLRAAAESWIAATHGSVWVVLGPCEVAEASDWRRDWHGSANSVWTPHDISALIALLAEADSYLGNDSGPSHVAAALRPASGVICYASTEPCSFGPRCDRFEAWAIVPGQSDLIVGAAIGRSLADGARQRAVGRSAG